MQIRITENKTLISLIDEIDNCLTFEVKNIQENEKEITTTLNDYLKDVINHDRKINGKKLIKITDWEFSEGKEFIYASFKELN